MVKPLRHIEARNRADNVSAFDALVNQGVEPVALTDAEKQAWLGMQQPGEADDAKRGSAYPRRRLSASRRWSEDFRQSAMTALARINRLY